MIGANFLTSADRPELLFCMHCQLEDHGVARRTNALFLLDDGMSCSQIAKVLFLDDDTVRSWHKQYLAEDWKPSPMMGGKAGSHG
jgi:transposase